MEKMREQPRRCLTAMALNVMNLDSIRLDTTQVLPTAAQTDPVALGWMLGSPPPANRVIQFEDGSFYAFPQFRWSFSNYRQLVPTTSVSRGAGVVVSLPSEHRKDLDAVSFTPLGKTQPMTWAQAFDANFTDGLLVMHKGKVVYERYADVLGPEKQHMCMSVTKSFIGLMGAVLVAEGCLDETAKVAHYVPELKEGGFGDANIRQLLDMRTGIQYNEGYLDPQSEFWTHMFAGRVLPHPPGYQGPDGFHAFMPTVKKMGEHGGQFAYKTINTDVLGWVISRATGKSVGQNLTERIWSKLGMEQDAYFAVDAQGTEFAGGGLNACLRDMARFGEMMRNQGCVNDQQIIPLAVVQDIAKGGDKSAFPQSTFPTLPGWSYRNMWWVSGNEHEAYCARGIHGQTIYIDPRAEMVIARFASFPMPHNPLNDPTSLPAYMAVAKHLMT